MIDRGAKVTVTRQAELLALSRSVTGNYATSLRSGECWG